MNEGGQLLIVCSDRARNGKTLLARLLADWLRLRERPVFIIDLDAPAFPLAARYADASLTVDFSNTMGRVATFDAIMERTNLPCIVDVPARHFDAFTEDLERLDLFTEATRAGMEAVVHFLIDRDRESLERARALHTLAERGGAGFVPVRNAAIGDALKDEGAARLYVDLLQDGEILLPKFSAEAWAWLEASDFSFADLLRGRLRAPSSLLDFELQDAVNGVFEQFERLRLRLDMAGLKDMGLI